MIGLCPVAATENIGPVFTPKKKDPRGQYAPEVGETCSLTDRIYQDKTSQQKVSFPPHLWELDNDYIYATPSSGITVPDRIAVITEYKEMIREHIERRVLFFFQQLIVCYKTQLHFESVGAQDQGKSAKAIIVKGSANIVRQAAHSSGNPCLIAYDLAQWEAFEAKKGAKPEGFVFLKGSDYYRMANSTMNMPKPINDADREIDEKTDNSLLRKKGEDLLNRAAKGEVTPDKGVTEYVEEALTEVRAALNRLTTQKKDAPVQEVLQYEEEFLEEIQRVIENDPTFLEKSLDIKMGGALQNGGFKRVILQIRYTAIRNCQINQGALLQRVEKVRTTILTAVKASNRRRKPNHFEAAFRTNLIACAKSDLDRQRLEKLLNFSPCNFAAQLSTTAKTQFENTRTTLTPYVAQIDKLAREVLSEMGRLRREEMKGRGETIKELRKMNGWTQRGLAGKIKQIFPAAAASQPTISRIENRQKLVTPRIAEEFSQVFGVGSCLFMPCFYYE